MMKKIFLLMLPLMLGVFAQANAQKIFGIGDNSREILRKGLLDYKNGRFDDAINKYNSVYINAKNDPLINYNLGTMCYKKGNYDTAAYFFDNAIKYVGNNQLKSKAYYNLGTSYLQAKKYDKAIKAYSQALKYNPDDDDSRYNLSYALRQQKQQPQQQQKKQQQSNNNDENDKKDETPDPNQPQQQGMDKEQARQIINSLNNREQELNAQQRGQGNNTKSKDW